MPRLLLILLLLVATQATALRRLSPYLCKYRSFVLAQGAETDRRGVVFSDNFGRYEDARIDDTGAGTALLKRMPACLQASATPVKVTAPQRLGEALAWIEAQCVGGEDCIVYSAFTGVHSAKVRVEE
jgi:hypothetical protein